MENGGAAPKPAAGLFVVAIATAAGAVLLYRIAIMNSSSSLFGPAEPNGVFLALSSLTGLAATVLGLIATYRLMCAVDWLVARKRSVATDEPATALTLTPASEG